MNISRRKISDSLLDCIMNKELFRKGNKADIKKLKGMVIKSKLSTEIKRDFVEYLSSDDENTLETLRVLIFDFLSAENAIKESRHCEDINAWVRSVVDALKPSVKEYTNHQIDLVLALILYEQTTRDPEYDGVFGRFTEVYQNEGGVY